MNLWPLIGAGCCLYNAWLVGVGHELDRFDRFVVVGFLIVAAISYVKDIKTKTGAKE